MFQITFDCFSNSFSGFVTGTLASCIPAGTHREVCRLREGTEQRRLFRYPESSEESPVEEWQKEPWEGEVFRGKQTLCLEGNDSVLCRLESEV